MAAGDLITLPWQLELNGVLFGSGTSFVVREFDPWTAPEVRQGELARAQSDGSYPGQDRLGMKLVTAKLAISAATDVLEQAARRTLAGAWKQPAANATVPLVWMEDDGVKYALYGKPRLASTQLAPRLYTEARFVATDPRIYTAASLSPSTSFPTGGAGGLSFGGAGAAAPFVFSGAGVWRVDRLHQLGHLRDPVHDHDHRPGCCPAGGAFGAGPVVVVHWDARRG
jgi:hypothetical protein